MSDDVIRRLHRTWASTGDVLDAAAYDEACRRAGVVSEPRTLLYAQLAELIDVQSRTLSVTIPEEHLVDRAYLREVAVFHLSIVLFGHYTWRRVGDTVYVTLARDYLNTHFRAGDCFTVRLIFGPELRGVYNEHFYPNNDPPWPTAEADDDCDVHL